MSADSADNAAQRPAMSVSLAPQQRDAFFAALARLQRAHGDDAMSMSALIVDAVIQQAIALDVKDSCGGTSAPDEPLAPHVLIVDDDDAIRETLRFILESFGYSVAEAADGLSAWSLLVSSPRRLVVLLDNLMPGLTADELLEALDADHNGGAARRHAFILITASPQRLPSRLVARLVRLGAPVIAKPFELNALLDAVAHFSAPPRDVA